MKAARNKDIASEDIRRFKREIRRYHKEHRRSFPWRETHDPYHIFVSEVMLQQTQTDRVLVPYERFIVRFPDFRALACARLSSVLAIWSGLGYNRRAKFLWESAKRILRTYEGVLPSDPTILRTLPGIGEATAASIAAFAFDEPTVFIETNIRTVFIKFFFPGRENVSDEEIMPLVARSLDRRDPREWYFALMDYGVMLKRTEGNLSKRSRQYVKQSPFKGSSREARGKMIKALLGAALTERELIRVSGKSPLAAKDIVKKLVEEGMIKKKGTRYILA